MPDAQLSSDEIALRYVDQLPWSPYPFQEQAIFTWFESEDGLLVCAPTGTGKTVIAETALFEALQTGRRAYYTTPLIALTEQKFRELQDSVERWGYPRETVGLVTGNRRVNPDAPILVVVAEILLNRLLSPDEFSFGEVSAVVMDEFHSFNDPERGIVWELSLGMLPGSTRVLLISATVGNAPEFVVWLNREHNRRLRLLQSDERRVPLSFRWVIDHLLPEQLELMANGDEEDRYTPALVFCFNRSECWSVAEQLKGRQLLADGQQKALQIEIDRLDWSVGAGGKLKQLLIRGVGIHHAGLLPRYRRAVESLFQKKLLSVCVCTETLAAGINLPARSVVMTSLIKGPPRAKKVIDPSSAQQMFGRAGRPQFDSKGYVFAVAHEDDVRLHRWQEKYDQIPEDTKDPMLRRAKKNLKKKMPKKRPGQQYWTEKQFEMLQSSSPGKLASKGRLPWRLLAFLVRKSGSVLALQQAVRQRLLDSDEKENAERALKRMLTTLDAAGLITLQPAPPHREGKGDGDRPFHSRAASINELDIDGVQAGRSASTSVWGSLKSDDGETGQVVDFSGPRDVDEDDDFGLGVFGESVGDDTTDSVVSEQNEEPTAKHLAIKTDAEEEDKGGLLGQLIEEARQSGGEASTAVRVRAEGRKSETRPAKDVPRDLIDQYEPEYAIATDQLSLLFSFRSVNSIYAIYLAEHMHLASYEERLQLLEAALDMPYSVRRGVRVPLHDRMPPGPLATGFADRRLLSSGLATPDELAGYRDEDTGRFVPPLMIADKIHLLFQADYPGIHDARSTAVWCVGDLLQFGGDFNRFVRAREMTKQEGVLFRHCLRMILLCGEFAQIEPPNLDPHEWRSDLSELAALLTDSCRAVDPDSTDQTLNTLEILRLDPDDLV